MRDQEDDEGNTVNFICQAFGEPVPTISWLLNDNLVNISDVDKYNISVQMSPGNNAINSTLRVMKLESSDVGTYTCNATNVVSSSTSSGVLTVNGELLV